MKKIISLLIIIFVSQGCASLQEVCSSYGFTPGTDNFANCVMTENHQRHQAWDNFSQQMQESSRQQQQIYRDLQNSFNNRIHCRTRPDFLGGSTTDCY